MSLVSYTIEIDDKLAYRLEEAARGSKQQAAVLIGECIGQHLDMAARHRAVIDRLEMVDQGLLELAAFIGDATAGSGEVDLSKFCKFATVKP